MSHLTDASIIKSLSTEVSKIVRFSFGEKARLLSDIPERINRLYSFMFRYQVQKENGEILFLLAKIPHQSWMFTIEEAVKSEKLREEVQFEYRVMQSIAQVISNSGNSQLTALNPLGCIVEWNAIVTEEMQLTVLKDYLVKMPVVLGAKSTWEEFTKALNLAGVWLRVVHQKFLTGSEIELRNLDIYHRIQEELSIFEQKNVKYIHILKLKFEKLYKTIQDKKILLSSIHDDYHLGNIFITHQGKVGAFDLNWKESRPIYDDLSKLLIDPSTRKMQVISQGLTFRPSLRLKFENEILKGYFENSPIPHSLIWFYCALAVLEKWRVTEEMLESRETFVFSLVRPAIVLIIRRYFSKMISQYLERAALVA